MEETLLSVTRLNFYIKNLIENDSNLNNVVCKGEISNLNKHYTGHYYFTLKDENSKISCMMFSSYVKYLKTPLNNGDEVIVYGSVSCYDKGGTYSLYCKAIKPYGLGQYLLQLEALKLKFKNEGIFDRPRKKIPLFPSKIALITSKSGAAVKDLIHTIQSRWNPEIIVFPCLVQGEGAPESMINALTLADSLDFDVIIIGRGGGANEDLKAFNDEMLCRKVASCNTPIISAVGHQIDTTIIDYCSDLACITPTDAGEKATPSKKELLDNIEGNLNYALNLVNGLIDKKKRELLLLTQNPSFISPLDYLNNSLIRLNQNKINLKRIMNFKIDSLNQNINKLNLIINKNMQEVMLNKKIMLQTIISSLKASSPYTIIEKGYSLVKSKEGKIISSKDDIKENQSIFINLKDGIIEAKVIDVKEK